MPNKFEMVWTREYGGIGVSKEQRKEIFIISSTLLIVGLILMFFSLSFGTSLGETWLESRPVDQEGFVDTSQYEMIVKNYINNFVVIGSILFGSGLLTGILAHFSFVLYGRKEEINNI